MYYSRNGGINWTSVRRGKHMFELGDHGNIVLAVRSDDDAQEFIYSLNDGDSWQSCSLGSKIRVSSLKIAPGWTSSNFILVGQKLVENVTKTVLIQINFEAALSRKCIEPTDFEDWSPTDEHGNCFMGSATKYRRRKFGTLCSYGPDYVPKNTAHNCDCSNLDYECEPCFFRAQLGEQCKMECFTNQTKTFPNPPAKFCDTDSLTHPLFFEVGFGARKVEMNSCKEVNNSKPKSLVSCAMWKRAQKGKNSWFDDLFSHDILIPALIVIGLLSLLVIGLTWYCFIQSPKFRASVAASCGCGEEETTDVMEYGLVNAKGHTEQISLLDGFESMDDTDLDLDV